MQIMLIKLVMIILLLIEFYSIFRNYETKNLISELWMRTISFCMF